MNAYFVKCVDYEKDENGNVIEIHCTYDPAIQGWKQSGWKKSKGNDPLGSSSVCR